MPSFGTGCPATCLEEARHGLAPRPAAREGAALVAVILLSLALGAMVHGTLVVALAERAAARAGAKYLVARIQAENAAGLAGRLSPGTGSHSGFGAIVPVADSLIGVASVRANRRRLGPELWLLEGRTLLPGGGAVTSSRLAWMLDPGARVSDFRAVVTTHPDGDVSLGGRIESRAAGSSPIPGVGEPEPLPACVWEGIAPDSVGGGRTLPTVRAAPMTSDGPTLGLASFHDLIEMAGSLPASVGVPGPREEDGGCVAGDPWNWGDPTDPLVACAAHHTLSGAGDGLRVEGGVGQGVWVVRGDLTLTGGARLAGLVLASGALTLRESSSFDGIAMARAGLTVERGSIVRGSLCRAGNALGAVRDRLSTPLPVLGDSELGGD